jgi:hypothetical protein
MNGEWVVIIRGPAKGRLAKVKEKTAEMYYVFLGAGKEASLYPVSDVVPATPEQIAEGTRTRRHADYGRVKNLFTTKQQGAQVTATADLSGAKPQTQVDQEFMNAFMQLMRVQAQFVADMGRRVNELMISNNELLERARKAEAECKGLRAELNAWCGAGRDI